MEKSLRSCQNCHNDFLIEPEDFSFYDKIKVPPPTFCPECRLVRRLIWRNERNLHKRKCVTKDGEKELITNYGPEVPFPIYEHGYWFSDAWDSLEYGQGYDFTRPFFAQLKDLIARVPQPHATNLQNVNSNYCNFTYQCKNCYLAFASDINEDCSYLHQTMKSKNSCDLQGCEGMDTCAVGYKSKGCYGSSNTYFSDNCIDSHLLWNCYNCQNCFGCVNLRNKSYCIFNEQYTKEQYQQEIKKYIDGSYQTLQENLKRFFEFRMSFPRKYADIVQSDRVTGDHIRNAKNCFECYDIANKVEDCKFTSYAFSNTSQTYDLFAGGVNMETGYEIMSVGENAQNILMSAMVWTCTDMQYSIFCSKSSNCFGCVGLRDKQYCILNKQYTKEEYEALVLRIIAHMNDMPYVDEKARIYRYGEFFPYDLSPFTYNETPAGDYYPLSKQEVEKNGWRWREKDQTNYAITMQDIPDNIADVSDSIVNEVIGCEDAGSDHSPGAFKIIPSELALYRKLHMPLPRKSPPARYFDRLQFKNPFKLWQRQCMNNGCQNIFKTPYAPERPEVVYCEKCYQAEVL